jgi:hypothetical protein
MRSKNSILEKFRSDSGFTFIEATISVVLISLIFLSFTVSMLAFREWVDRSWAVRVMDQYAHDYMNYLHNLMQTGKQMVPDPNTGQLDNFQIQFLDRDPFTKLTRDTIRYHFSADKEDLVQVRLGNTATKEFYYFRTKGREKFPPPGWLEEYKIQILEFRFFDNDALEPEREDAQLLTDVYDQAMVRLNLKLLLERNRGIWEEGEVSDFAMTKEYRMSFFMKNRIEQSD